tara:strand:+ start:422 stop:814 length:393 start_codon:yes stop_codon:yes gene_type:complete
MEERIYLIAIALAEQNNQRIMPIGGKTISEVNSSNVPPELHSEKIILDLLFRLFKRSKDGQIKMFNESNNIFLATISFEKMQKIIPIIKSDWINNGNTINLINKLNAICSHVWSVNYIKYEGIMFNQIND